MSLPQSGILPEPVESALFLVLRVGHARGLRRDLLRAVLALLRRLAARE